MVPKKNVCSLLHPTKLITLNLFNLTYNLLKKAYTYSKFDFNTLKSSKKCLDLKSMLLLKTVKP